jgi:hypothetical protein
MSESLEMLKSEEGQLNAVFACFGSAAQHCQFFEAALGEFLLVYNKIRGTSLTLQEFEAMEAKLQRWTMGQLLKEFKNHVKVGDVTVAAFLDAALEKRNFLMHHFFRDRQAMFNGEKGRMELLRELVEIDKHLETATTVINAMRLAMCEALDCSEKVGDASMRGKSPSKTLFAFEVDVPDQSP